MGIVVPFQGFKPEELRLRISSSTRSMQRVVNEEVSWAYMINRLKNFDVDELTLKQFKDLPETEQNKRKNHGYFVPAQFRGGIRKHTHIIQHGMLAFDIDNCPPAVLADLEIGTSGLGDIEYIVYSTYKNAPGNIRIRVVVPLRQPIDSDRFVALERILAQKLDANMGLVDAVSFKTNQLMYWPARCKDGVPIYIHNRGRLLDVDAVLDEFGTWRDVATLPRNEVEKKLRQSEGLAQRPREKHGIVGAFCRTYDIHDVIAEFLSDVYTPSETDGAGTPTRYTYIPGSGANGVVVYDDGQFMYSNHGTDPAGQQNLNPFDALRVHKFGTLDADEDDSVPMLKRPSYVAMAAFARELPGVLGELREGRYRDDDDAIDDAFEATETAAPATKPKVKEGEESWKDQLDITDNGVVKSTLPNITLILANDPHTKGKLAFDEFINTEVVTGKLASRALQIDLPGRSSAEPWGMVREAHLNALRLILEAPAGKGKPGWGLRVADRDLEAALALVARSHPVHPVRDYLDGLPAWDGVPRLEQLWVHACHTPDTDYYRDIARLFGIGAVQRIYEPGCKFDFVTIIEGPQGLLKSTLVATLAGIAWAGEVEIFDNQARFVEALQGSWLVEIPELVQFSRAEVQAIKAAVTRQFDHVRLAYGRRRETYPRQSVLMGTTNESHYLRDDTGNRRYWPVKCGPGQIDIAWVRANRDQIWAEARSKYSEMRKLQPTGNLPLYLEGKVAAAEALELQAASKVPNVAEEHAGMIEAALDEPIPASQEFGEDDEDGGAFDDGPTKQRVITCGWEIFDLVFKTGPGDKYDNRAALMIRSAMRFVTGWRSTGKFKVTKRYNKQRIYYRVKPTDPAEGL